MSEQTVGNFGPAPEGISQDSWNTLGAIVTSTYTYHDLIVLLRDVIAAKVEGTSNPDPEDVQLLLFVEALHDTSHMTGPAATEYAARAAFGLKLDQDTSEVSDEIKDALDGMLQRAFDVSASAFDMVRSRMGIDRPADTSGYIN